MIPRRPGLVFLSAEPPDFTMSVKSSATDVLDARVVGDLSFFAPSTLSLSDRSGCIGSM